MSPIAYMYIPVGQKPLHRVCGWPGEKHIIYIKETKSLLMPLCWPKFTWILFFFNSCFHCHDYHLKGECQKKFEERCRTQKITYLLGRIHTCVMRNLVSLSGNLPFSLERIISSMSPCSFSITTNTFSGVSNIHSRFTMPRWRKLWERGGSEQEEKGRRRRNRMILKLFEEVLTEQIKQGKKQEQNTRWGQKQKEPTKDRNHRRGIWNTAGNRKLIITCASKCHKMFFQNTCLPLFYMSQSRILFLNVFHLKPGKCEWTF